MKIPQSQQSWEVEALDQVVADCLMNQRLVEAGIWHKFIMQMNEQDDEDYSRFIAKNHAFLKLLLKSAAI